MTNKEKYPKTEDALKEYNLQLGLAKIAGCSTSLSFNEWLEKDTFEDFLINTIKDVAKKAESVNLFDALRKLDIRVEILKKEEETPEKKKAPEPITCPLCGSTETEIEVGLFPRFHCHQCKAIITYKNILSIEALARRIIQSNLRVK